MELKKFLQEDMVKFLDMEVQERKSHISRIREDEFQIFDLNKDYSKEVTKALEMDNVAKAQKTLREVKDIYTKLAENTEAKRKAYSILEEIYKKTEKYVESQQGASDLAGEIAEIKNIFGGIIPEKAVKKANIPAKQKSLAEQPVININIYGDLDKGKEKSFSFKEKKLEDEGDYLRKKVKEEIKKIGDQISSEKKSTKHKVEKKIIDKRSQETIEKEKRKIAQRREINNILERLYGALKKRDVEASKKNYMDLKRLLDTFPFKSTEEKEDLMTDFVSLREQIKELEKYKQEKDQRKKEEDMERVKEEIEERREQELDRTIKEAEHLAKNKDFHRANFEYLEARHKLEKIKDEETIERFTDRLERLKQKILLEKVSHEVKEEIVPLKKEAAKPKKIHIISKKKETKKKRIIISDDSQEIYKQGIQELYNGKKEEAARLFKKVLELNPKDMAAKIRLKEALGEA